MTNIFNNALPPGTNFQDAFAGISEVLITSVTKRVKVTGYEPRVMLHIGVGYSTNCQ